MTIDPQPKLLGIVIKADGRVPFDADCHPEVRKQVLAHLKAAGHELDHPPHCSHHKGHDCDCACPTIKNWRKS